MPDPQARLARRSLLTAAGLTFCASSSLAQAQTEDFPNRPIRIIVPFPAGGSADAVGRLVAEIIGRQLNVQAIVDNRAGGGGVIGTRAALESRPDGYTLVLSTPSTFSILPTLREALLSMETVRSFTPIGMVGRGPFALAVSPQSPFRSASDLIAAARVQPGTISYGTAGIGTTPHLVMELLRQITGAEFTHIPFRGGGPAVTALLAGQIQMVSAFLSEVAPFAADDRLRLLAITSDARQASFPAVPTLREGGVDLSVYAWFGVHGPADLPAPIVEKLHSAINAGLGDPAVRQRLAAVGIEPTPVTRDEFIASVSREIELYGRLRGQVALD
ncbi:tripartite tricarboxylate transporter substrate binding protein [Roseomonas terrae]|uniref:Tripartite tricarboxylate transporter substrate binding protein n=1 Tax=Neoroseomonas terrae TaxID=424799 RepID=A0ABS5ELU2_9PROT|nr:tripartite tricarboxylate transporter substrate binding protein [Neoroseomonas terrae]MBR0652004.1 tripartite tricarboxylate transporter substrate binding protein [Neoroseomonas terrae]